MIDFSTLFSQFFATAWWLLPLFAFVALLKSPWFKEVMGEAMVNFAARIRLDKNEYHLVKSVFTQKGGAFPLFPLSRSNGIGSCVR